MNIIVRVTDAQVRGTPFGDYALVLGELISSHYGYRLGIDDVTIKPGQRAEVLIDGQPSESPEALDMLAMAENITDPEVKDGYFD